MKLVICFAPLALYVVVINSTLLDDLQHNVNSLLSNVEEQAPPGKDSAIGFQERKTEGDEVDEILIHDSNPAADDEAKFENKKQIRRKQEKARRKREVLGRLYAPVRHHRDHYAKDPILNSFRRAMPSRKKQSYDIPKIARPKINSNESLSSSVEMSDWEKEWELLWKKKQYEAKKAKQLGGDVVNMAAARPWGVPCGDANQHDMPWGTCVLVQECEAEDRVFRGDSLCGRTDFVCCALQLATYDMMQGNDDASLEKKDLSVDTQELMKNAYEYKKEKERKRLKTKKKRTYARYHRKKKIRKNIVNIIKEISKMLRKMYTNTTSEAKKKTKHLQKFIKRMKKKFKKERQAMQFIHDETMVYIDNELLKKIVQLRHTNKNFINNSTFRDILMNGTINQRGARMLVEAYPELYKYIPKEVRSKDTKKPTVLTARRSGSNPPQKKVDDYLEYDIEYGYLYY